MKVVKQDGLCSDNKKSMSRKTLPVLAGAVSILLATLVVIIALMLSDAYSREARLSRRAALSTLLDSGGVLDSIVTRLESPLASDGSLASLFHYLSKDPGRSRFPRAVDRRRQEKYLSGEVLAQSKELAAGVDTGNRPAWAARFAGDVTALFSEVEKDIADLLGVPPEIAAPGFPVSMAESITMETTAAVGNFGRNWIPSGELKRDYSPDRELIRKRLINDRRFQKRMTSQDMAWRRLGASLYSLSVNHRWRVAVEIEPSLSGKIRELTVLFISADLQRRTRDLMAGIVEENQLFESEREPGILWIPQLIYYKNIPEITGQTLDEIPTIYIAKVNIGYSIGDRKTQDWLNSRKDYLTDYFQGYFSNRVIEDFSPISPSRQSVVVWRNSRMKAEALYDINSRMIHSFPFGVRGAFGLQDLAFVRVNLLENP